MKVFIQALALSSLVLFTSCAHHRDCCKQEGQCEMHKEKKDCKDKDQCPMNKDQKEEVKK